MIKNFLNSYIGLTDSNYKPQQRNVQTFSVDKAPSLLFIYFLSFSQTIFIDIFYKKVQLFKNAQKSGLSNTLVTEEFFAEMSLV